MSLHLYKDLNEPLLVITDEELRRRNKVGNNICNSLNSLAVVVSVVGGLLSVGYPVALWVLMLFSLLMLWAYYRLDKLVSTVDSVWEAMHLPFTIEISFSTLKPRAYPSIFIAIFLPVFVVSLSMYLRFNMAGNVVYWLVFLAMSSVFAIFRNIIKTRKLERSAQLSVRVVSAGLFTLQFVYSLIIIIDCIYDQSSPAVYQARILKEDIEYGRNHSNSYYLTIAPWGPVKQAHEFEVDKAVFFSPHHGFVHVYVKKGVLHIPWYEISN